MNRTISILLAAGLSAGSASAATITAQDMPFAGSTPLTLEMERTGGPRGTGRSVVGDSGQPVWKTDPGASHAYGRYGIDGGPWLDSQDGTEFKLKLRSETKTRYFDILITDACDQRQCGIGGKKTPFEVRAKGASWSIPSREPNATGHWLRVSLLKPARRLAVKITSPWNDGFGAAVHGRKCK